MREQPKQTARRFYIYVSGPYSPTAEEAAADKDAAIQNNIEKARNIAFALMRKGHIPFVPHTMMEGWEDRYSIDRNTAIELCEQWVARCDAFFFIGSSPGAEQERKVAVKRGLPIYRNIEDVPNLVGEQPTSLSTQALEVYLEEYKQCAESYRHTYTTIWQAGALIAAGAGLLAASSDPIVQAFAPLPPLAWYLAVFLPMDRYGELRTQRLQELEDLFSSAIPGLQISHFRKYNEKRKEALGPRRLLGRWRVKHALVTIMLCLGILQGLLLFSIFPKLVMWLLWP